MSKLLRYMKGYYKECVLGPLLKLFEATLELLVPYVIMNIVNVGIASGDTAYIVKHALLLVGMGFFGLIFSIAAQYFSAKAAVGFTTRIREVVFSHIQSLTHKEIDSLGRSTLITRLTSDMNQVQTGVNLTLRLFLRSPFIVFGAGILAYTIDREAALTFLWVIPALSVVVFGVMLIGMPLYKKVQQKLDAILNKTRENLLGVRPLRALCKEEEEVEEFADANRDLTKSQLFVGKIATLMNPLTYVIVNLAIAVLMYKGAIKVEHGVLAQGAILALYNYMSQILIELIKLANLIISITKALASAKRVSTLLEVKPSLTVEENGDTASDDTALSLEDVAFRYNRNAAYALENLTLSVGRGETLGIIGGTGAGKTTLVQLICRFYDTEKGTIRVFGRDIRNYTPKELIERIGLVPQKVALFKGTVRSNLCFGNRVDDDERLWEALRLAQAEDFVRDLEGGLDAAVEQGGNNLSGGQKQRLTVARALLRRPELLILDDASSALDYVTDLRLRRAISELDYRPTVLLVSQRVSALRSADRILVLDEGEPVGIGTHEELYQACDVYREICDSQSRMA